MAGRFRRLTGAVQPHGDGNPGDHTSSGPDPVVIPPEVVRGPAWDVSRQIAAGAPSPGAATSPTSERFRQLPYRPDTVVDGWDVAFAAVRLASMRGHEHRFSGAPRQDDAAVVAFGDRVVVLVADGVSAADHAHVGATSVTRYAAAWLEKHREVPLGKLDFQSLFTAVAWNLVEQAAQTLGLTEPDPVVAAQRFATTLVVCAVDPLLDGTGMIARLARVGDSSAWVLTADGSFTPVFDAGKAGADGLVSHATVALPQVSELEDVLLDIPAGEVLLVGTDGFGDPLAGGEGEVGDLFRAVLGPGPARPLHLAHALDFSRERFDDDRTLVAVWPRVV